jgi:hypothetical protein
MIRMLADNTPRRRHVQYQAQGRYAQAETLNKRSLAIYETALAPEHPSVTPGQRHTQIVMDHDRSPVTVPLSMAARSMLRMWEPFQAGLRGSILSIGLHLTGAEAEVNRRAPRAKFRLIDVAAVKLRHWYP